MSIKAPCKDCKDRKILCHSTCEKYKEFKDQWEEFKRREKLDKISYSMENSREGIEKMKCRYIGKMRGQNEK